jgi:hypothetical protein
MSIQCLMGEPNPDDPLRADVAAEYRTDRRAYTSKAREHTQKYAMGGGSSAVASVTGVAGAAEPEKTGSKENDVLVSINVAPAAKPTMPENTQKEVLDTPKAGTSRVERVVTSTSVRLSKKARKGA